MKKSLSYFVVGLLLISSIATIGIGKQAGNTAPTGADDEIELSLSFSQPSVKTIVIDGESFVEFNVLSGASAHFYTPGAPILPIYTTTITLPFGTKILDVEYENQGTDTMSLSNKIIPAPQPVVPLIGHTTSGKYVLDENIYNSASSFPNNWVSYYTGGGLDGNNEHKSFLTIRAFPVRYSPMTDTIEYINTLDITISTQEPDSDPFPTNPDMDLVIIAPSEFEDELQKLVDHKNTFGIRTYLKTTNDIYSGYSGVDKPEKIKYFIKDAIETEGIKYVMLIGGMKSLLWGDPRDDSSQGTASWHVPVRYTNLKESGETYDPGFISDLYYADIYDGEGEFSSWDSDGDGVFAEYSMFIGGKDIIDLYPDVYVGRLACRNIWEVKLLVNKIINYEKEPSSSSWFYKMVGIGGDSHEDSGTNYVEGEVACDYVFDTYMTEFSPTKLYASYKTSNPSYVPSKENIVREISAGCGHLLFEGHGHPGSWNTHWPNEFTWDDTPGGIDIYNFPKLSNDEKLPVCVIGGCHNSQFNVTLFSTLLKQPFTWTHGLPTPECFSWHLVRKIGGGTIASLGNTGLGYGAIGNHGDQDGDGIDLPDTLEAVGGYQIVCFYKTLDEGKDILGEAWGGAQKKYLDTYPGMEDRTDCKTVEQWPLLGDPSLKIGGYGGTFSGLKTKIDNAEAGIVGFEGGDVELHAMAIGAQGQATYKWDLDNDGSYDDGTGATVSHSWNSPGAYWVSVQATDAYGQDTYDTIVSIEPEVQEPYKPSGSNSIKEGQTYTYATTVNADGWNNVYYQFSWGDGTFSTWSETNTASHSWDEKGSYDIRARVLVVLSTAEGEIIRNSEWSDPLSISLSNEISSNILVRLLQKLIDLFPILEPILQPIIDQL